MTHFVYFPILLPALNRKGKIDTVGFTLSMEICLSETLYEKQSIKYLKYKHICVKSHVSKCMHRIESINIKSIIFNKNVSLVTSEKKNQI